MLFRAQGNILSHKIVTIQIFMNWVCLLVSFEIDSVMKI